MEMLSQFLFIVLLVGCQSDFIEPDDWKDPFDMTNPQHIDVSEGPSKEPTSVEAIPTLVEENAVSHQTKSQGSANVDLPEELFLKRFIAFYLKFLPSSGEASHIMDYDIRVFMNKKSRASLAKFSESNKKVSVQEAVEILEQSFQSVSIAEETSTTFFDSEVYILNSNLYKLGFCVVCIVVVLTMERLSHVSWMRQIKRSIIIMFVVSYVMEYILEYQLAVADQRSKSQIIPDECLSQEKSYIEILVGLFSMSKDPCLQYHEDKMIHPMVKVPPTKVLASTLTKFFVEPMKHIGLAFSEAFRNVFEKLPLHLYIPAMLMLVILCMVGLLILTVYSGYSFNFHLPFWSGLEIGPQNNQANEQRTEQLLDSLRQQVETLKIALEDAKHRSHPHPALPPPPQSSPGILASVAGYLGIGRSPSKKENPPENVPGANGRGLSEIPVPSFKDEDAGGDPGCSGLRRRLPYPPETPPHPPPTFAPPTPPPNAPSSHSATHSFPTTPPPNAPSSHSATHSFPPTPPPNAPSPSSTPPYSQVQPQTGDIVLEPQDLDKMEEISNKRWDIGFENLEFESIKTLPQQGKIETCSEKNNIDTK